MAITFMKILNAAKKYISDDYYRFLVNTGLHFYDKIPDEEFLKRKFKLVMGKELDLENPKTFNEKLQWLKLYDRKPEYTMMADKYAVRKYIAEKLGKEYLIPLLGVWDNTDDIDFDKLPDKFVLKCNHNSGLGMCICKDKSTLNIKKVKRFLKRGLKQNYYLLGREWPYKNIKHKIIAEQYMDDGKGVLTDYKFMCFNGRAEYCFVCKDRNEKGKARIIVYDRNWNKVTMGRGKIYDDVIESPVNLKKMLEFADILSKNIPFVRIDFYEINGRLYFGEITFFPGSGLSEFTPKEWDLNLGKMIDLHIGRANK